MFYCDGKTLQDVQVWVKKFQMIMSSYEPYFHGSEAFDLQQEEMQRLPAFPFQEDSWILYRAPPK